SNFRAAGQTCICANRTFVQSGVYDEIASEETFSPVAGPARLDTEEEAIRLARRQRRDHQRRERPVRRSQGVRLRSPGGSVGIDEYLDVGCVLVAGSEPRGRCFKRQRASRTTPATTSAVPIPRLSVSFSERKVADPITVTMG